MIQLEDITEDWLLEVAPLLALHYEEIGSPHGAPLEPQWEVYMAKATAICYRTGSMLMGYWIGFVGPELHHRNVLAATTDIFWVHPISRGCVGLSSTGLRLFRGVEKLLRAGGVDVWYTDLPKTRDYKGFLEGLGHKQISTYYAKNLRQGGK